MKSIPSLSTHTHTPTFIVRPVRRCRYNKREEAQEAISALNNVIPEGASQPMSVRLAEEHGKAKAVHFIAQMGMNGPQQHVAPPPPPPPQQHMQAGFNNIVHRGRPSYKPQQRFHKQHPHPYLCNEAQKFV